MSDTKVHREQIAAAYKSPAWKKKVAGMNDERVYAIWCRMFKDKPKKKPKYEPFWFDEKEVLDV